MADVTTPNIFAMPNGNNGMFGSNDGGGFMMGALMGRLLFNNGIGNENGWNNNGQNADRAAIDSAVSAALASNNQANNNAMLLLKDIQDSSQGVTAAITAASNAETTATLNAEIANLQGQGILGSAIQDSKYTVTNEIHEAATDVIASTTANTAQLAATMNTLGASLAAGHAELNSAIQQANYDNTLATMSEGEKTRTAIAALAAQIPNSRELDLQRQLGVALADHRH